MLGIVFTYAGIETINFKTFEPKISLLFLQAEEKNLVYMIGLRYKFAEENF